MTKQPKWCIHAYIGDSDPTYGATFIYRDLSGVYGFESETVVPQGDEGKRFNVYRYILDQWKRVIMPNGEVFVVPVEYEESWSHPIADYRPWFLDELHMVAEMIGTTTEVMVGDLCSDDPIDRAWAHLAIGDYYGMENLDAYPLAGLTAGEVRRRYRSELRSKTVRGKS